MSTLPGRSIPRLEDALLLRGEGRFVDDLDPGPALHAAVVRSEHAHATLAGIDGAAALAVPGCIAVHTGADLQADGIGPLPCIADPGPAAGLVVPPRHALAVARLRYVGEPVALVVARSPQAAAQAAAAVQVDARPLPAVVEPRAALAAGAVQLWEEAPGNLAFHYRRGDAAAVAAVMATAAHVIELALDNHRVSAVPLEPRAGRGTFDPASGRYTLLCNAMGVHAIRAQLAAVLGVEPARVRVWAPDVGGGFGMKNFLYPEWVLLTWAARRHGQAVAWTASRGEELAGATHGRDVHAVGRLALDAAGHFLALQAEVVANLGACLSGSAPNVSTRAMPTAMGGIYAIAQVCMQVRGVFTNTAPVDAYRGAGKPEANFLIERLVETAARRLGHDPLALRRANAVHTFPHVTAMGTRIDGGRFATAIDALAARAGREGLSARRAAATARGRLLGLGFGCFLETARGAPQEGVEVAFTGDGAVELRVGTESHGQGHATAFAQIAAARLGLPLATFRLVQADTARTRIGFGHGGARSMHMGGAALVLALDAMLDRARRVAARLLQAEASALDFADGRFTLRRTGQSVSLLAVAAAARDPQAPAGLDGAPGDAAGTGGLDTFARVDDAPFTLPNGCHAAEVEVDPETGAVQLLRYTAVDDYGNLINPRLAAGQVQGGVAQGIGQALMEQVVYDPASGQLLTGSLLDYALPRAADLPALDIHLDGVPTDANPLGVKGTGQAGCIVAPQVLVHAVLDALAPLGVEHLDMPLTSERIWRALRQVRSAGDTADAGQPGRVMP